MFTIEERIRMYEEKLGRVVFPLRTTHYDTKLALDLLLHKNHFTDICRLAFGPIGVTTVGSGASSSSSSPTDDVCWMDVANNGPDTPIGQRILHFLAPGGIFHSVMENLSVPNGTFHASIKSQWKDQVVVASPTGQRSPANDGVDLTKRFDYPLSALCGFSKQVISENRDADLTSMGRHRIPPFMLIPFWQPPLVTREESTTRQPQNSLPCTMLGYFMLRMMQFVHHRCCSGSRSVLSEPKESSSTWRRALKTISSMVSDAQMTNCREFPATLRLLAAYHEFYNRHAAQNHYSKLQLSRSLDDASWDVGGTVLQMLIHCPSSLWLRRVPLVVAETQRLPFADAGSVACLTVLVPYLADVLQTQTQVSGMAAMAGNPMTDANSDARLTAAFDVQRPHIAVYRNGLSALRSATQNYARIQQCAPKHFEHLLQLWKALLLPCAAEANQDMRGAALSSTRESSVLQRYEALTYGFGDVVGMIGNSACIDVMTEAAAQHFMSCLGIFRDDLVARVLADTAKHIRISTEGLDARSGPSSSPQQSQAFVSYLKAHFVLHWDRSDGLTVIPHMEGPEIQAQVARAVMAIWRRTDPECLASTTSTPTLPPPVVAILRQCSETLLRIVPGAKSQAEKLRDDYSRHASTRHQTDPMAHSMTFDTLRTDEAGNTSSARMALPPARTSGLLSNDERQQYLDGNSGACRAVRNAGELKFPTRQGRRLDVVHSGEPILRSDEFPPLVVASLWIDDAMELLQTIMHRRRVPRCHNGHPMWLVEDVSKRCNQHHDQEGTWECHACQVSFCSAYCRPVVPVDPANQLSVLRPITPAEAQRYCCDQCHMVFVSDRTQKVFTSVVATEAPLPNGVGEDAAVYCAQCASRPFRPTVTRVVAAYSTMWAVLTACIFSWLLWVLIRPR